MKATWFRLFAALTLSALSGCSSMMLKAPNQTVPAPDAEQATIVFMRHSSINGAIGADLFDIQGEALQFLGQLSSSSKIVYRTAPGKKVFMAYGSAADFMLADVVAGKTYYVIVRPNWGTGGFAPTPIRTDGSTDYNTASSDFQTWLKKTTRLELKPEAQAWFEKNRKKFQEIYGVYWPRFNTKNADEMAQRTLRPTDGV